MMDSWFYLMVIVLIALIFQSFFTMVEMAFVSMNRLRLNHLIAKGNTRALWLGNLLRQPTYLFGTTLIGVNFFLQIGSESARRLFYLWGLNPDYSMLSQLLLVVIFAELAPMFAARAHAEHVSMLGITPIYFLAKLLYPITYIFNIICRLFRRDDYQEANYLSREELQKAIEVKDEHCLIHESAKLKYMIDNIFALRSKTAKQFMTPMSKIPMAIKDVSVSRVRDLLSQQYAPYVLLYYPNRQYIYGILYTRDLLKHSKEKDLGELVRSVWFVSERNSIQQMLEQFRWNKQKVAVVLSNQGKSIGVVTLDGMIEEIFEGKSKDFYHHPSVIVDKHFSCDILVKEVNKQFGIALPTDQGTTLEELMRASLGRSPHASDHVRIGDYRLTLEPHQFLGKKKIYISTVVAAM